MTVNVPQPPSAKHPVARAIAGVLAFGILAATLVYLLRTYSLGQLAHLESKSLFAAAIILHGGLTFALITFVFFSRSFSRRTIANTIATASSLFTATTVMFFSVFYLREPQIALDWAVMIFSGIISGIFIFFIVWGHFQQGIREVELVTTAPTTAHQIADACPKCMGNSVKYVAFPAWMYGFPGVALLANLLFSPRRRCVKCGHIFDERGRPPMD